MTGESDRFPPHDERAKIAWNKKTGLHELLIGPVVIYRWKSHAHYRSFCLQAHAMEYPLEMTETP